MRVETGPVAAGLAASGADAAVAAVDSFAAALDAGVEPGSRADAG